MSGARAGGNRQRSFRNRAKRPPTGSFTIAGRRAVVEAIAAGRARAVLIVHGARRTEALRDLLAVIDQRRVPVQAVERRDLDELHLGDHQGVAAIVELPPEIDDRGLAAVQFTPDALVVVLDGISDPQNLGAAARAAEAAGVAVLILRFHRAAPVTAAAVKASAGALLHLPIARVTNLTRTIEALQGRGFTAIGLDHRAELTIHGALPERPLALVVGAEGAGLSRLVREQCDWLVSIPMRGRVSSLNASAALAVALFSYANRPEVGGVASIALARPRTRRQGPGGPRRDRSSPR